MNRRGTWTLLPGAAAFAYLLADLSLNGPLHRLDLRAHDWLAAAAQTNDLVLQIGRILAFAGHPLLDAALVAAACAWLSLRRQFRLAFGLATTATLTVGLALALQLSIKRALPGPPATAWAGSFAFPSGYAVAATALLGLVAVYSIAARAKRNPTGPLAWKVPMAVWASIAALAGCGAVLAQTNWVTDVLAGWALGAVIVLAAFTRLSNRHAAAMGRRATTMAVHIRHSKPNPRTVSAKVVAGFSLMVLALVPGWLVASYWRILSTVVFSLILFVTLRLFVSAAITFKRPPAPPPKPEGTPWPKVTILVPAYNEANVLPATIASMDLLDYPKDQLEFVYIYAASKDATADILQARAALDPRAKLIAQHPHRIGKAAAINDALPHCTGEFVISLDADQVPSTDAVKRVVCWFLAEPNTACVKARPIGTNIGESPFALMVKLERDMIERGETYAREVAGGFTFFGGGQVAFRQSMFSKLGKFREDVLLEDIDLSIRIHAAGFRLRVDPEFVTHEEHPASPLAWWTQRRRWVRGGMQISMRHLGSTFTLPHASWRTRLDMLYTHSLAVLPALFLLGLPLSLLAKMGWHTSTYYAPAFEQIGWTIIIASPFVAWLAMRIQDSVAGVAHPKREWIAVPFLGFYMGLQSVLFADAFIEEFVLRSSRVFVKTHKTGSQFTARSRGASHKLSESNEGSK